MRSYRMRDSVVKWCKRVTYLLDDMSFSQSGPQPSGVGRINGQVHLRIVYKAPYPFLSCLYGEIISTMSVLVVGNDIHKSTMN